MEKVTIASSHRDRPQRPRGPRLNHAIRITPIRVIGPAGEQIGVIETADALRLAEENNMDLVEVSPDTRPPVCKIMDYGKHKYDQSKKANKNRAAARASGGDLKEVRLGRSVKIDKHDVEVRISQARKFLMQNNKVQLTQRFRGREIMHKELGLQRLKEIAEALADISKVESPARWTGRSAFLILAPDRAKVKALKKSAGSKASAQEAAKDTAASKAAPEEEPKEITASEAATEAAPKEASTSVAATEAAPKEAPASAPAEEANDA